MPMFVVSGAYDGVYCEVCVRIRGSEAAIQVTKLESRSQGQADEQGAEAAAKEKTAEQEAVAMTGANAAKAAEDEAPD